MANRPLSKGKRPPAQAGGFLLPRRGLGLTWNMEARRLGSTLCVVGLGKATLGGSY